MWIITVVNYATVKRLDFAFTHRSCDNTLCIYKIMISIYYRLFHVYFLPVPLE